MKDKSFAKVVKYTIFIFIMSLLSLLAICAVVIGVVSIYPDQAEAEQPEENSISMVGFSGDIDIYQDEKTGVQYLVYRDTGHGVGITYSGMCPRYNADGTLYTCS